jgi:ATP-binding cassette subfamily B protein
MLYPGTRALINNRIEMDVRERFFNIILGKGYRFFNKFRTGDLVTRLTRDVADHPKIAWFACSGIFRAVESTAKLIFIIAMMLYLNWKLTLLSITPLPVMIYIFYVVRIELSHRFRAVQDAISQTNDALESCFSGVRILKAYNGEEKQAGLFRDLLDERIDIELRAIKLWQFLHSTYFVVNVLGQLIVIIVGGIYTINGVITIGDLYAFYMYLGMLLHPLLDIPNLFATSKQAFVCVDRLEEIKDTPGGTEGLFQGTEPIKGFRSLELRDVKFRYDDDCPWVLDGVNIKLEAGTKAAVVGPVGCGKSTLIKLVAGMLPAQDGDVFVNERPLEYFDVTEYRRLTGYIPQEPVLFSESVKDNVIFGRDINEDQVWHALEHGQVDEEVKEFADGADQMLGQRGLTVSGGQKQRIAIARALAGHPQLLLMDDCTASLDAENEEGFWEMFAREFPNAACLIVTHRLATAKRADVIYVLDEGCIVGSGTHEELLETCEAYRNFQTRIELETMLDMKR